MTPLREDVQDWVERLQVEPPILRRRLEKFSGGNQQKSVLARWLRTNPKVLILDEPTQGVDVGAKTAIYEKIDEFARNGGAVIVTSPDPEELVRLCDRVLVLRGGMIACELSGSNLTTSRIVTETLGATSLRAGTRVVERKLGFTVIRDDAPATTNASLTTRTKETT
jgi:ribose transport system ATP-binding protein